MPYPHDAKLRWACRNVADANGWTLVEISRADDLYAIGDPASPLGGFVCDVTTLEEIAQFLGIDPDVQAA